MTIEEHVSLAPYTTLQVGGPARYFTTVTTLNELTTARQFAQQTAVPLLLLGSGSNLLVSDEGFPGLVIHNQLRGVSYTETDATTIEVTFGAGEILDDVIADSVSRGYWGLENLSHIPGTVGATPVQNVGAYGVEIADLVVSVSVINLTTGETDVLSPADCQFGYRDSIFKTQAGRDWCITAVTLRLSQTSRPVLSYPDLQSLSSSEPTTPATIRDRVITIRSHKFPDWQTVGTAGSFFKNPIIPEKQAMELKVMYPDLPTYAAGDGYVKVSLGYILDKICGLKGYQQGPVGLYEHQALVLINHGQQAADIAALADHVRQTVADKTGITIEQEVTAV